MKWSNLFSGAATNTFLRGVQDRPLGGFFVFITASAAAVGGKAHKSPLSFAECLKGKKNGKIKLHLNGNPAGVKQQFYDFSLETVQCDRSVLFLGGSEEGW